MLKFVALSVPALSMSCVDEAHPLKANVFIVLMVARLVTEIVCVACQGRRKPRRNNDNRSAVACVYFSG